jgi:hypothetical protein
MPIPATQFIWFNGKLVPWEGLLDHVDMAAAKPRVAAPAGGSLAGRSVAAG